MMTVLDDDALAHPALECVFTTDEETGLVGAETLDKSKIDARIMINLDSEEEGVATVSCAGGVVATLTRSITREHMQGSFIWSAATATSSSPASSRSSCVPASRTS